MAEPLQHSRKVRPLSKTESRREMNRFHVIVEKTIATIEAGHDTGLSPFEAAMMAISKFCETNDGGDFRFQLPGSEVIVSVNVAFVGATEYEVGEA